jgi:hypothetical protein
MYVCAEVNEPAYELGFKLSSRESLEVFCFSWMQLVHRDSGMLIDQHCSSWLDGPQVAHGYRVLPEHAKMSITRKILAHQIGSLLSMMLFPAIEMFARYQNMQQTHFDSLCKSILQLAYNVVQNLRCDPCWDELTRRSGCAQHIQEDVLARVNGNKTRYLRWPSPEHAFCRGFYSNPSGSVYPFRNPCITKETGTRWFGRCSSLWSVGREVRRLTHQFANGCVATDPCCYDEFKTRAKQAGANSEEVFAPHAPGYHKEGQLTLMSAGSGNTPSGIGTTTTLQAGLLFYPGYDVLFTQSVLCRYQ